MSGIVKPLPGAQLNLSHPLAQGLVGCWLMNENSGKYVHDYSGQNNEGTIVGMNDPPIATSGWNAGPHGGALAFDGVNDYVDCGDAASLNMPSRMTLIAWINPVVVIGVQMLIAKRGGVNSWQLFLNDDENAFSVWQSDGSAKTVEKITGTFVAGKTYQFVGVADGSCVRTDINGVSIGTPTAYDGTIKGGGANVNIGRMSLDAFYWTTGLISSVSIYNRALSAEEIAYLYAFPYCMFEEAPIWQMFDPYRAQRAANHYRQMRAA